MENKEKVTILDSKKHYVHGLKRCENALKRVSLRMPSTSQRRN